MGTSLTSKDALEPAVVAEINRVRIARGLRALTVAGSPPAIAAREAVERWLNSEIHRRILLGSSWRQVAVAVVHVTNPPGYWRSWNDVDIVVADFGRSS